jgi:hypothetical protein
MTMGRRRYSSWSRRNLGVSIEDKDKLNAAFNALRVKGFLARQSFSCCGSCASYEIADTVGKLHKAGKTLPLGSVFYTRQDATDLRDEGRVFIAYGQVESYQGEKSPVCTTLLSPIDVGKAVVEALLAAGIPEHQIDWNGNPDVRIRIDFNAKLPEPVDTVDLIELSAR